MNISLSEIVNEFFASLKSKNIENLKKIYHTQIMYSDPLYGLLHNEDVFKRWQFFCNENKIENIEILDIKEYDHEYAMAHWDCTFYYGITHKKVTLSIKSFFKIENNVITEQSDAYRLSKFISQAYGIKGLLFGWIKFMQHRVKRTALKNLFPHKIN